jgi:hypothetical protein
VRKREFGRGDSVAAGRVHHDHAALGGRVDIDVVHTDASPANDLQLVGDRDHLGGDLRLAAHHYSGGIGREFLDPAGRQSRIVFFDDLKAGAGAQESDTLG